jgi:hypothetical protein
MGCAFSSVVAESTNTPTEKPLRIKIPSDFSRKEMKIIPVRKINGQDEGKYGSYFKD